MNMCSRARPALTHDESRSLMNQHRYAAGQHISYAEHGPAEPWKGGYAIVALLPHGPDKPQYQISHADQLTTASSGSMSSPKTWGRENEGDQSELAAERSAMAFCRNRAG